MNKLCKRVCLLLAACALYPRPVLAAQVSGSAETVVIAGGTLIDGTGREPLKNAAIVIQGNLIRQVGEQMSVTYPKDARIINAAGKYILPGLFDSHVHYRDFVGELFLAYGVTSIIDMGNPTEWILAQRDAITKGLMPGPRIFAGGDRPAGRTPEEARKATREVIASGVQKIGTSINQDLQVLKAILEESHKAGLPVSGIGMYPKEAIGLGLDALEHSYTVSAGTKKDPNVLQAMRQEQGKGKYEKNHLNYLVESDADDFIRLLVQNGTYVIPSLIFEYKVIHEWQEEFDRDNLELLSNPNLRYLALEDYFPQLLSRSEAAIPKLGGPGVFGTVDRDGNEFQQYFKGYRENQKFLRKLVQAGGNVLVGTDAPNMLLPGLSLHHELQLLVDAGLSPMQVIVAATKLPAAFMRAQNQLGTIEPGKLADLLIVQANPLDDIRNAKKIELVMKAGRVLDTSYHPYFANLIPRTNSNETQKNAVPTVTDIAPKVATEGDVDVSLTLEGRNFVTASVAVFDGTWVPTRFVKETELQATVPARLLERVGTFPVTVWSPRPGGGMSNDIKFIVKFR